MSFITERLGTRLHALGQRGPGAHPEVLQHRFGGDYLGDGLPDQRIVVLAVLARQLDERRHLTAAATAADHGALIGERGARHPPAIAEVSDHIADRDANVVEEDLVEVIRAAGLPKGLTSIPGVRISTRK